MSNIVSVLHGFDKEWEPIQDACGQETSIFYRTHTKKMVTRTGILVDIIETSNGKYLGVLKPIGGYTILGDPMPENNKTEWKGYLSKQNDVVYQWDEN